ncbi:NAD-dependent succinate-semialdehyde dehydrogenase [Microbulbifer thermotolerans]|uniref:NAD-dependent succinate-semialdehyde dehydrogenase n=1 Tax=Microbulbifer thermotolerans TaxID=252514 RepID=UPI00224B63AC|nr:NAD-dependent succinate-semialdehyde dehydrogenase [Microbulbifer thermotolerans]MCX2784075.1 NAD-dependent succinate-semialdehyde dehydrogenase [Microbulbifer thermotolerans]
MTLSKCMYIGGELCEGNATMDVVNPATEQVVGRVAEAGVADACLALEAAERAFPLWSGTSIAERVEWMQRLRQAVLDTEEHLRECVHLEMGKPWASTEEDFRMLAHSLAYYAEEISRIHAESLVDRDGTHVHLLSRQPVGVAAAFLAWNFPLLNLAYKLGPAMAAGCPIVIKPSSKTPLSAYAVGELCAHIGLPAGVVNIISGVDHEIGNAISSSTIPALITLIGSTQTGMHVMRNGATSIKRYSMELGGNAPVLIFPDADLDLAADVVCGVKFANAGQICVTPNRVFVHSEVVDSFREKVLARTHAVKVGYDRHGDVDMGPVIDGAAWERIHGLVRDAVANGARLLTGGGRPEGVERGSFYAPTVIDGVSEKMRIYREEVFGPVISLLTFDDDEAVIAAANDTEAGLSSFIFTQDRKKADWCAEKLRFGEVQINGIKYAIDLPHCGVKQSGIGVDCSPLALDDYLAIKRVTRAIEH